MLGETGKLLLCITTVLCQDLVLLGWRSGTISLAKGVEWCILQRYILLPMMTLIVYSPLLMDVYLFVDVLQQNCTSSTPSDRK